MLLLNIQKKKLCCYQVYHVHSLATKCTVCMQRVEFIVGTKFTMRKDCVACVATRVKGLVKGELSRVGVY